MLYSMDKTNRLKFEVKHFDAFKRTMTFTVLQNQGISVSNFEGM